MGTLVIRIWFKDQRQEMDQKSHCKSSFSIGATWIEDKITNQGNFSKQVTFCYEFTFYSLISWFC